MEGISKLIYQAYSLVVPDMCNKQINQIHYDFIWNKKGKGHMVKLTEEGG